MSEDNIRVRIEKKYSNEEYAALMNAAKKTYGRYTKDQLARTLIIYEKSNLDVQIRYKSMMRWKKKTLTRLIYEITPNAKVAEYRRVNKDASVDLAETENQEWSIGGLVFIIIFIGLIIFLVL